MVKLWKKIIWITLIEVLIAIYIFGIGILVILRMLISNISRLYDLRAKDTAVSLAKEAIDIVFNLRDSNIEKWMNRDCGTITYTTSWVCSNSLLSWSTLSRYIVDVWLTWMYSLIPINSTGEAALRYHTWTWYVSSGVSYTWFRYNHDAVWGQETQYLRWIEIFPQPTYQSYTDRVLWVRSIVEYTRWSNTKQVMLESIIGDMR